MSHNPTNNGNGGINVSDLLYKSITNPHKEFIAESVYPDLSINRATGLAELNKYDMGLGRGGNQQALRHLNQSNFSKLTNAVARLSQIPFSILSNVGAAFDIGDYVNQDEEVGNWLSNWAEGVKKDIVEATPIYRRSDRPFDIGDFAWWQEAGSSLVESAIAFVATGEIFGGLGALASKATNSIKWLQAIEAGSWLANTVGLNQAESLGIAVNVYDQAYRDAINEIMDEGPLTEEGEQLAKEKAAKAAATSINVNRANILLNLSSAKLFIRSPSSTKNVLSEASKLNTARRAILEGGQEAMEEINNLIAEKKGLAQAAGKEYGVADAMQDIMTREGLESAVLGFIGGAGQTALTAVPRNMKIFGRTLDGKRLTQVQYHNEIYKQQKKTIDAINDIAKANNFKDVTDIFNTTVEQGNLIAKINALQVQGKNEQAEELKGTLLANQALKAFEVGATEPLLELYKRLESLSDEEFEAKGLEPEYGRRKAKEAQDTIKELEKIYVDNSKYLNLSKIFRNRSEQYYQEKAINSLEERANEVKKNLSKRIENKIKSGKFTNKLTRTVEEKYGERPGDILVREKEITVGYNLDNLDENPYTDPKERATYNTLVSNIKKLKEYNDLQDINKVITTRADLVDTLDDEYAKMTSKEYQAELNTQREFATRLQDILENNPNDTKALKKLTDEYKDKFKVTGFSEGLKEVESTIKDKVEKKRVETKKGQPSDEIPKETKQSTPKDTSEVASTRGEPAPDDLRGLFADEEEEEDVTSSKDTPIDDTDTKEAEEGMPKTSPEFNEYPQDDVEEAQNEVIISRGSSRDWFAKIAYRVEDPDTGEINEEFLTNIHPDKMLEGEEVTLRVDSAIEPGDWPRFMDSMVESADIQVVYDSEVVGYIHRPKWFESRIESGKANQEDVDKIREFRRKIIEARSVKTFIKHVGGNIHFRTVPEAGTLTNYTPDAHLVYMSDDGKLYAGDELHELTKHSRVINADYLASLAKRNKGKTYVILPFKGKDYVAHAAYHRTIAEHGELGRDITDSIVNKAREFLEAAPEDRDIGELRRYIRTFIRYRSIGDISQSTGVKYRYAIDLSSEGNILIKDAEKKMNLMGKNETVRFANDSTNDPKIINIMLKYLRDAVEESRTATSASHMEDNAKVVTANNSWDSYNDYLKDVLHINVKGVDLNDGKYAYTLQHLILLESDLNKEVDPKAKKANPNTLVKPDKPRTTKKNVTTRKVGDHVKVYGRDKDLDKTKVYDGVITKIISEDWTGLDIIEDFEPIFYVVIKTTNEKGVITSHRVSGTEEDLFADKAPAVARTPESTKGTEVVSTLNPEDEVIYDGKRYRIEKELSEKDLRDPTVLGEINSEIGLPDLSKRYFHIYRISKAGKRIGKTKVTLVSEDDIKATKESTETAPVKKAKKITFKNLPSGVTEEDAARLLDLPDMMLVSELSESQVDKYKELRKNLPFYIEGMSPDKIEINVRYIVNELAAQATYGEAPIDAVIDKIKQDAIKRRDTIENNLEVYKELGQSDKAARLLNNLDNYLENFDAIVDVAIDRFANFEQYGVYEGEDDEFDQDNIYNNYQALSYEKNDKLTVSKELKLFLAGIKNVNPDGSTAKTYLGQDEYISWDVVYNTLKAVLADGMHNYEWILARLVEASESRPWIKNVITKLNETDNRTLHQFVSIMPASDTKMRFLLVSTFGDLDSHNYRVLNSNSNDAPGIIARGWIDNIYSTDLYNPDSEDSSYSFNKEYAQKLIDEYNQWVVREIPPSLRDRIIAATKKTQTKLSSLPKDLVKDLKNLPPNSFFLIDTKKKKNQPFNVTISKGFLRIRPGRPSPKRDEKKVRAWLGKVGIELSDGLWDQIIDKKRGYRHGKRRIKYNDLFEKPTTNSVSILASIAYNLNKFISQDIDVISEADILNTPISDSVIMSTLAKLEARHHDNLLPNSYRDEGKSIYSYSLFKFATDRLKYLKDLSDDTIDNLRDTAFSKDSVWLDLLLDDSKAGDHFRSVFDIEHVGLTALKHLGRRSSTTNRRVTDLSDGEQEMLKVGLFQDLSQGKGKAGRVVRYFFPTLSVKESMLLIKSTAEDFATSESKYINVKDGTLTQKGVDYLYERLVKPELNRILEFNTIGQTIDIKGYRQGAGKFLFFPEFNDIELSNGFTVEEMLRDNGEGPPTKKVMDEITSVLKDRMVGYIYSLANNKIDVWKSLGLQMDYAYYNALSGSKDTKLQKAALDFEVNNLIAQVETYQTFIGDPALFYKPDTREDATNLDHAVSTFDHVTRRLASQLAPGEKLSQSENSSYYQLLIQDSIGPSIALGEIKKILGEDSKAYEEIEGSDSQEFTTALEELYTAQARGELPDGFYSTVVPVILKEISEGNHYYTSQVREAIKDNKEFLAFYNSLVFQPRKPVYTGQIYDNSTDHTVMRNVYIKSSSFALFPHMTANSELDKLRVAMERIEAARIELDSESLLPVNGTVRVAFSSATKLGNFTNPLQVFNEDGTIKDDIDLKSLNKSTLRLPRRNFRIQQVKPFKSATSKDNEINRGTQEAKELFLDFLDEQFTYKGKKIKGYTLFRHYDDLYRELYALAYEDFLAELGIANINDLLYEETRLEVNKKLAAILQKEAHKRSYNIKDRLSLSTNEEGDFILPLWASSSHFKYESLIHSIVKNRILKHPMPGYGYILGTEEGFRDRTVLDDTAIPKYESEIVWTSSWTGKLLSAAANNGISQVIAPSKFRDNNGNLINLMDYAIKRDGKYYLDESKFTPEILKLFGFRIPTSGPVSMTSIEIVGFLPYNMGDLIIAPRDLVTQIGHDFDIDMLYAYMYYMEVNENDVFQRYSGDDKVKLIKNELIDIHHAVIGNPKASIQRKVIKPLSYKYAIDQANLIQDLKSQHTRLPYKWTPLSTEWQKEKMLSNASGQTAIGAASLDVTFHALAQTLNKEGTPIRFRKKIYQGDDVIWVNLELNVGGLKSDGKLGNDTIIDNENILISQDNSEVQNFAVDNETAGVISKINFNQETFNAELALRLLGFSRGSDGNSLRYMLLSQPIIVDYVNKLREAKSSLKEYDPDVKSTVIEELIEKYASADYALQYYYQSDDLIVNDTMSKGFKDLTTKNLKNNLISADNAIQLKALDLFLLMDNYGGRISTLETLINTDASGIPKSGPEVTDKINTLKQALKSKALSNVHLILGDGLDSVTLNADRLSGIAGASTFYGLTTAERVNSMYFPYSARAFSSIMDIISSEVGIEEETFYKRKAKLRTHVFLELKKWFHSNVVTNGMSTTRANIERKRLFIDSDTNESLAKYLRRIKQTHSLIDTNTFISLLETRLQKNGMPSLITYNNSAGENIEENIIYSSAYDLLLRDDMELPDFNGQKMTPSKLLQELALYAYLEGGIQEAVQFIKFIPYEYLVATGFADQMRLIDFNDPSVYGDRTNEIPAFVRQYFQHHPGRVNQITSKDVEIVDRNTLSLNEGSPLYPLQPRFISRYNASAYTKNPRNKWSLFEKGEDGLYHRLPILGVFGMSEYEYGVNYLGSSVNRNPDYKTPAKTEVKDKKNSRRRMSPTVADKYGLEYDRTKDIYPVAQATELLDKIAEKSSSPYYRKLAIYYASMMGEDVRDVPILAVRNLKTEAKYEPLAYSIKVDVKSIASTNVAGFEEAIMHEMTHYFTVIKLAKLGYDPKSSLASNMSNNPHLKRLGQIAIEARDHIIKKYGRNKYNAAAIDVFREGKFTTSGDRGKYYGIINQLIDPKTKKSEINLYEFVAQVMSSQAFQKELGDTQSKYYKKTLLQRFIDFIRDLLVDTGILPKSITSVAMNEVISLIKDVQSEEELVAEEAPKKEAEETKKTAKKEVTKEIILPGGQKIDPKDMEGFFLVKTMNEFTSNIDPDQANALRELRRNGLVKTKCK